MTIRILEIIPTLVRGGAEKQLALLAAGLPRERFETHVAVLTHTGPLEADLDAAGVPLHFIGKRWKFDPFAWRRMKTLIQSLRPDIVHTWLFAANSYGRTAARSAGVKHIVGGERCVDPWKLWYQLAIDRRLAKRSDCIVTNSSGVREFYQSKGIPADKFEIIPNGVPPGEIARPSPLTRAEFLATCGLPDNARAIIAVGRLWRQKRIKDLIWAADLLKCVRDDTHLLLVGDGPQRERLEVFREQCEVTSHVHFLGARNDVAALLPHCECLWLGSGYEGQSNAILEAMAAGLPVVATDIPGNRDLVVPDETGYLVPIGDRASFARQTSRILESDELKMRLGAAGQARIREHFPVAKMIDRHAALYERLIQQR